MKVYVTARHKNYYHGALNKFDDRDAFLCGCAKNPQAMAYALSYHPEPNLISVPDSDPRLGTFEV